MGVVQIRVTHLSVWFARWRECIESQFEYYRVKQYKAVDNIMLNNHSNSPVDSSAKQLAPKIRQKIAIYALSSNENISQISRQYDASRKFVYAQKEKASDALDEIFSEKIDDSKILFYIPVTKEWLRQAVMSLILSCHSSYGGVI